MAKEQPPPFVVRGTVQGLTAKAMLLFINEILDYDGPPDNNPLEELMGRRVWLPLSQLDYHLPEVDGIVQMLGVNLLLKVEIPMWLANAKLGEL